MSLLNRPSVGFHSSLVVIYKLLLLEKKLSKERIIKLCDPPTLDEKEHRRHVAQTLNTWTKLGLFVSSENDEISISQKILKKDLSAERLQVAARAFVLQQENNERFFEKESSGSADFTRLLAWSLMQDVWKYHQTSDKVVGFLLKKQTNNDSIFQQNDTRWAGFKAWSQFLGFAWTPRHPASKIEPDPTVAIRDMLTEVFGSENTQEAPTMINRLSDLLPVLDGGVYRKMVEERLGETEGEYSWRPLPPGQLSTSLSRSLIRLREEETLVFENRDDSEYRLVLTGRERREIESVTHFTLKGGKS
ncbi:MAG: hypothetical protein ACI9R3_005339 [Verrucomicrobiales bacterium]|jgi:hypothetical protein